MRTRQLIAAMTAVLMLGVAGCGAAPAAAPTAVPTSISTPVPTEAPTSEPTALPTEAPTSAPIPTQAPTSTPAPTQAPTEAPTSTPVPAPTQAPTSAPTAGPQAAAEVTISGFAFAPVILTIKSGTTVTWTNEDSTGHTVVSDNGDWQSAELNQGDSFSHTFDQVGAFAYHCSIHPTMIGTIVITD